MTSTQTLERPKIDKNVLIEAYIIKGLTRAQIAYSQQYGYGGKVSQVDNDLKFYEIPLRAPEIVRTKLTLDTVVGKDLNVNTATITSNQYDVSDFGCFVLHYDIEKVGTPSAGLQIQIQFSNTFKGIFTTLRSGAWGYYVLADTVIPALDNYDGPVTGHWMQVNIIPVNVTTLDADNYFTIKDMYLELS